MRRSVGLREDDGLDVARRPGASMAWTSSHGTRGVPLGNTDAFTSNPAQTLLTQTRTFVAGETGHQSTPVFSMPMRPAIPSPPSVTPTNVPPPPAPAPPAPAPIPCPPPVPVPTPAFVAPFRRMAHAAPPPRDPPIFNINVPRQRPVIHVGATDAVAAPSPQEMSVLRLLLGVTLILVALMIAANVEVAPAGVAVAIALTVLGAALIASAF